MKFSAAYLGLFCAVAAWADTSEEPLQDPFFGEALFYAEQGEYFEALERLDTELAQHYGVDEPELDSLQYHVNDAEFSVGDFELSYRMHHRAGRAITAVLEGDVEEEVRNEAAFRLARIHFQKAQFEAALRALDRIDGQVPARIRGQTAFLRANVLLAIERPGEAAETLRRMQSASELDSFVAYNLGVALLQDGRRRDAMQQLGRAGMVRVAGDGDRSIRDKANLVRGTLLMEDEDFLEAQLSFDRVRLEGPLSNQALLSAGWASASAGDFERAVVPWGILAERDTTDAAVQEARLALPYAYGQLEVHGRAALLYGDALQSFDEETRKVEASIESVRQGRFLEALVREEIRQDEDWVIRLRSLPESPETYYLMQLLASHDFQTALQNYLDLEDLRSRLTRWQGSFDAFEEMTQLRREYYEPRFPVVDQEFRELDSRIRLRTEQYELLQRRLQDLLIAPRPEFLATEQEREVSEHLSRIQESLSRQDSPRAHALLERAARLRGILTWTLETQYHDRLTQFDAHLRELQTAIDTMTLQYDRFVRARQAAAHSFEGYQTPVRRLRTRVNAAQSRIDLLMARQGHVLELVAVEELLARRARLNNYRDQARFALADSYDRAIESKPAAGQQSVAGVGE